MEILPVPPAGDTLAVPSQLLLHKTSVTTNPVEMANGSEMVCVPEAVQPFASETETVYVPAQSAVAIAVVCAAGSFQEALYGAVPPVITAVATPSHNPLHETSDPVVVTDTAVGDVMVTVALPILQPFKSTTVTVYVPGQRLVAVAVVCANGSSH